MECGDRYNVGLKGSQIAYRQRAFDRHYKLLTWMTLNCASLDNGIGNNTYCADKRFIERISC